MDTTRSEFNIMESTQTDVTGTLMVEDEHELATKKAVGISGIHYL